MQGQLFSQDFLTRGVLETQPWQELDAAAFSVFKTALQGIFQGFDSSPAINEAQTETLIIDKTLKALGWGEDWLPQVNLSIKGRRDVPDYLLFADNTRRTAALAGSKDADRYRHGIAILEAKSWMRPLDRGHAADPDAPSSQMLRYLSRADVMSDRAVKWGILTNGALWRLYWQDARSRAEEFFEIDLAAALALPGTQPDLDHPDGDRTLRLFHLFFSRPAFLPQPWDSEGRSFHAYALNEARLYEERVAQDLGARVFNDIFAQLADALARGDLEARTHTTGQGSFSKTHFDDGYLDEVREAALVLLYRLLFLFYAEDRKLLPVHDERYAPYSVRRIREEVRDKVDSGAAWSSTLKSLWLRLEGCFQLVDVGDDTIGMPAYNGGLFDHARSPLLARSSIPDKVLAPIIDALSRRTEDLLKGWINYRDLSVAHLGGIYERLLEYRLVHEDAGGIDRILAKPASFARKVSGSYYTHDDLVRLILRESVGLLAQERRDEFESHLERLGKKQAINNSDWELLDTMDPANRLLELKICDPAMGSGHFLVALVDDLADRVLEAMAQASQWVNARRWAAYFVETGRPWQSPVLKRIAAIRHDIRTNAQTHGWSVSDAQLDDRHIVRRMILKKVVFGVDKNPMAVELAKTALWLHTFTVGAPLSFLDHHLKTGDSLHGEQVDTVRRGLQALGALLLRSEFDRLARAARAIAEVADLTDVDIAEVQLSKRLATEAQANIAPMHAVLDFWRALRWMAPGWPVDQSAKLAKILPPRRGETNNPIFDGLVEILNPGHELVSVLAAGQLKGRGAGVQAANELMAQARALARRETFFHWWTSFPTVFGAEGRGGFDAVIGNPPWDRIKLQEVEWFAERDLAIAAQPRAADRKELIGELEDKGSPLWDEYLNAMDRAEDNARVLGNGKFGSGDYPLLGNGDLNLYSLFVERAQSLIHENGIVALLTPSGIAADKGAAEFFNSIASTQRLSALFDFENKKVFFPDVDSRFKFCALVFGGSQRIFEKTRSAFFLHSLKELDALIASGKELELSAEEFSIVNPNTGAAPIFRCQRDADITIELYRHHPVLVRHGKANASKGRQPDQKAWPVKYLRMFDMTNDSKLFLRTEKLQRQGWKRAPLNRWGDVQGNAMLPLYEGKMVQMFDHRAADVVVHAGNLHRAAQQEAIKLSEKANPARYPAPQFFVNANKTGANPYEWALGFKEITAPTNMRSMIAALMPGVGFGNKVPLLIPMPADETPQTAACIASLLLANFNSFAFDFVLRQKLQGQTINLFILEQLPVIAPARFDEPLPAAFTAAMRKAGLMNGHHPHPTVEGFVIPQVLALSYTAHDLAPFARDLGYVDAKGEALPPFIWNEEERRARMAGLDALFFHLYGLNAEDAAYVLDTFPIVREQDERTFGRYRTKEDVLALLPLLKG
ncbi:MAG: Eco57I restriction-modification methylase domain-containing protein [Betaproteobacteria bacterium]|nr:Eco57I restriction-modification methylase domain-containing protein [Betaproteobacteria bacterium]